MWDMEPVGVCVVVVAAVVVVVVVPIITMAS